MRLHQIVEYRRNPEKNPKEDLFGFLSKYKDDPKAYLHTTSIPKVGIYPRSSSSHDTPVGVFAYRIKDIWEEDIMGWRNDKYNRPFTTFLSYYGGPHFFILRSDIDPDFAANYTEADLAADCEKIKEMYDIDDTGIERLRRTARTNLNFRDMPVGYLWGMTKAIIARVDEFDEHTPVNPRRWNSLLRRLGYVGFNDTGHGYIHGAEATQAVFLTASAYEVVNHLLTDRRQPTVKDLDKKYVGGHLPKNLVMAGIPNTFFLNNSPEAFKGVRTWRVNDMSHNEFGPFLRFLPWNATGIIGTLSLTPGRLGPSSALKFLNQPVPERVTIETLYIGTDEPWDMQSILEKMPPTFPAKKIKVLDRGVRPEKLPDHVRSRLELYDPFAAYRKVNESQSGSIKLYHITDNPKFKLDPLYEPVDNSISIIPRDGHKGIYVVPSDKVERWVNGHGYIRPFIAEIDAVSSVLDHDRIGRWSGEIFIPADQFEKMKINRVIPIDAFVREEYGAYGWIERSLGQEFDTGKEINRSMMTNRSPFRNYKYDKDTRNLPSKEVTHLKRHFKAGYKLWSKR